MYVDAPASTYVDVSSNATLRRFDCGKVNGSDRNATLVRGGAMSQFYKSLELQHFSLFHINVIPSGAVMFSIVFELRDCEGADEWK